MLGHVVSLYLKEKGHNVTGLAHSKSRLVDCYEADARDLGFIKEIVEKDKYDVIVNCIGILNQFAEKDHENAVFLNSYLPH